MFQPYFVNVSAHYHFICLTLSSLFTFILPEFHPLINIWVIAFIYFYMFANIIFPLPLKKNLARNKVLCWQIHSLSVRRYNPTRFWHESMPNNAGKKNCGCYFKCHLFVRKIYFFPGSFLDDLFIIDDPGIIRYLAVDLLFSLFCLYLENNFNSGKLSVITSPNTDFSAISSSLFWNSY